MSAKIKILFSCQSCGHQVSKWLGKCSECNEWNSFVEGEFESSKKLLVPLIKKFIEKPKKVIEVSDNLIERHSSGIKEFDRVLGGGIVKGSLVLVGGEPGIGKSTLLSKVASNLSVKYLKEKILYISGEESIAQVAKRIKRIGHFENNLYIYHETTWQNILKEIEELNPKFLIIDSIQTTASNEINSQAGSTTQVKEVTFELMNLIKSREITCFLIGHVTKEGNIAGPKVLEHMVDTVIYFEGDQVNQYRLLRVNKNRYGNTNEVGIFEMNESGLIEVNNPSQYFLDETLRDSFGRSLTCILEGTRPMFVEVQALVVENKSGNSKRITQGLDLNRLSMLIAIIEKYFSIPLNLLDIYVNVIGGIKLMNRESDLSIIAAILSGHNERPINEKTIFLGEVGLTGEVRSFTNVDVRMKEISLLGYKRVITSKKIADENNRKFSDIDIIGISKSREIEQYI